MCIVGLLCIIAASYHNISDDNIINHDNGNVYDTGTPQLKVLRYYHQRVSCQLKFGSLFASQQPCNNDISCLCTLHTSMAKSLAFLKINATKKIHNKQCNRTCKKFLPLLKRSSIKKQIMRRKKPGKRRFNIHSNKQATCVNFWRQYAKLKPSSGQTMPNMTAISG